MDENTTQAVEQPESPVGKPKRAKTKFHMPTSLSIVMMVLAAIIVLTWILHWSGATYEDLDGVEQTVDAGGILSIGGAITSGFINAGALIMYLLVLGGFIEIMMRTGALEQGIKTLVSKLEGKEIILIPLLFTLFSLGGTVYGMQEETVGFFILIVPFLILAGFDSMTGLLVVLLGTTTGFAASTVNPFSIAVASDSLGKGFEKVGPGDGLGVRFVIWIAFTIIGIVFLTSYAYYVQKKPSASFVAEDHDKNMEWAKENFGSMEKADFRKTSKREIIGLSLFATAFIIMIIMYIPWGSFSVPYDNNVNGITNPDGSVSGGWGNNWSMHGFGWLFNGMNYPGYWYFGELVTLFLIFCFAIGYTFQMKTKDISDAMWTGAKDILPVAIIIGVARAIPAVMSGTGTDMYLVRVMTNGMSDLGSIGFLAIIFVIFLALACFIPSTSGLAGLSMPIIGMLTITIFGGAPDFANGGEISAEQIVMISYMIIMFSIATGIVNMFIPTQAIVLASAEAARVPYLKMLKPVFMYVGILILFTLGVIVPILGTIAPY